MRVPPIYNHHRTVTRHLAILSCWSSLPVEVAQLFVLVEFVKPFFFIVGFVFVVILVRTHSRHPIESEMIFLALTRSAPPAVRRFDPNVPFSLQLSPSFIYVVASRGACNIRPHACSFVGPSRFLFISEVPSPEQRFRDSWDG